jgi:hypothetical protein
MAVARSTAARLVGATSWGLLRAEERRLVVSAGLVFALASAGVAMSAAAADAMFLAELGAAHLGGAVAASSALLAIVLAVVGGLADRMERRRVLASLAGMSAFAIAGLAALSLVTPRLAAAATLIGGKQLAAATDLAFWVVIAERLDARRSRRLLPMLGAIGGAGGAIGAVLVVPVAAAIGVRGVLGCAAVMLALAGAAATRLPATRRLTSPPPRLRGLVTRSWRDGAHAVRRHPLARYLALVVAAAGVFASLAYFALGVAAAAQGGGAAELAALLGGVRGTGQLITLVVQLAIAPRLLGRLGTGYALLLAPLAALAAGLGLMSAPILAVAIATQVSARVFDAGIETPAERLAQTLLPGAVRGRVAGFLDGTAKRAGAVLGGLVAAILAGWPAGFYAVTATAAALWLIFAARIARELPALAIDHVQRGERGAPDAPDEETAVDDDRSVALLVRELAAPRPERAAELLVRLHGRGRIDAVGPLVAAATTRGGPALWRALIAVLGAPGVPGGHGALAKPHGPVIDPTGEVVPGSGGPAGRALPTPLRSTLSIAAAFATAAPEDRALAVRALGLTGTPGPLPVEMTEVFEHCQAHGDPALALAAAIARGRLSGGGDAVLAILGDAVSGGDALVQAVALDELGLEAERALGAGDPARALAAARQLARMLRRGTGSGHVVPRAAGFAALARVTLWLRDRSSAELVLLRAELLELARERVESAASPTAPANMLTSLLRTPNNRNDDAPEVAAALRLYGAVLDGAEQVDPDDLRQIARALGELDDDVRVAAEAALAGLGVAATGELIAAAAWGPRRARDRAAALLAELPVTAATIDRLIDNELDALDLTHAAIAALTEPDDALLVRRLEERIGEIAHTVLLLVAASRRSPAIARAAVVWRHARGGQERARTLAVIEAALPRVLIRRLVEAVDLRPADRRAALVRSGISPPTRDAAIGAELAGRDRLARALALHTLGAAGRSAHRDTIANAARAEAIALSPGDLVHKLSHALGKRPEPAHHPDDGGADMPSRVETLISLSRVTLLAQLTTRQLADLAERARWVTVRAGSIVITNGDLIDALIVVEDGELAYGDYRITKGCAVDELACVAPTLAAADLRAVRATRMIRLERVDFEELVDDVPGLASAVCRALGERARRAEDDGYRSPLTSRA